MDDTPRPLRVVALTSTNLEKHLTWRLRVELMLPHLRARDIEVDALWVPKEPARARTFFASLGRYDIAWLHRRLFWPSELRQLSRVARHLVLDIDDPVDRSSSSLGNFSLPRCLKFRATARRCAAILAASDGLVDLARAVNPKTHFVPLCADPDCYTMRSNPRWPGEPLRLLWLGGKSTFKYLEQKRVHLDAIGRALPRVELVVVGHSRLQLSHLPVHNVPWGPESEREQLARCHVGLVPMADDRWTRAKAALKPLQYLASGMPFIGSPVGVNLRLADEERNGLLADKPAAWVQAVDRLERDEPLRRAMGQHGIEYVRRYHSPEVLAEKLVQIFHGLVGQAAPKDVMQLVET